MTGTSDTSGTILRIQRMSTEDGPGIRSTVFFKGCPLSCVWCHNPESISPMIQVHWVATRCIGCRSCIEACPEKALRSGKNGILIDRQRCTGCLKCTGVCPSTAMEAYGRVYALDDLVPEVLKDKVYFEKSGGGVTLSGGEPTLQAGFCLGLLRALKEQGVHTALDTCGQCAWDTLATLLPHADMVLYDLKVVDTGRHRDFTGVSNTRILENLTRLGGFMKEHHRPQRLWVRTPLIPGCTATEGNLRGIGAFLRNSVGQLLDRWELCAFNNLCLHKYEGLGLDWQFRGTGLLGREEAQRLAATARGSGVDPRIVHLSGAFRLEDSCGVAQAGPDLHVIKGGCA
ncbi:MAG TPA: glycyl-radical enzyme activating protein [Deltaproteobacteria bacterium]|nr:glycyl-radical enzyme activating protein [Deltaproteobacteria bacterium]HQI79962.1 glycyl-radical enzyme activating protein [Deltaproteobacteria bacterium]